MSSQYPPRNDSELYRAIGRIEQAVELQGEEIRGLRADVNSLLATRTEHRFLGKLAKGTIGLSVPLAGAVGGLVGWIGAHWK